MTTSFSLTVGQTIQLNLEVDDAAGTAILDPSGNPSGLASGPTYNVDNPALATLTPNATGVAVLAVAAGAVKVTASGTNSAGGALSAESDGTIAPAIPLAVSMKLTPGTIT